ncbi:hypothetical protein DKAM_0896 [Desulfurococcus amylolyticus 1221n]|uniref:Uncharacterized protein n=1 Tax=Desulfurococcus amylolyticus (strain DSM 18924 / JCM 16383 / VKM B-2413 / 1221n) TaxID=490899 RepID=B8D541_DESA1|nr:hypothetical protein DKAM_0896 [Desulfurococcus amylolyticus 1221n]
MVNPLIVEYLNNSILELMFTRGSNGPASMKQYVGSSNNIVMELFVEFMRGISFELPNEFRYTNMMLGVVGEFRGLKSITSLFTIS